MSKYKEYEGEYVYEKPTWEYRSKNLMINDKSLTKILWIIFYIRSKNMWGRIIEWCNIDTSSYNKKFGEGTKYDLDYGKLVILFLCVYIAIKVS